MPDTAPEIHTISEEESRIVSLDFYGKLDSGELLTGTPTVTEEDTSDLVISGETINSSLVIVNNAERNAGYVAQFKVSAGTATVGATYDISVVCNTDAGQVLEGIVQVKIN